LVAAPAASGSNAAQSTTRKIRQIAVMAQT
jgi:hypothetical protein